MKIKFKLQKNHIHDISENTLQADEYKNTEVVINILFEAINNVF